VFRLVAGRPGGAHNPGDALATARPGGAHTPGDALATARVARIIPETHSPPPGRLNSRHSPYYLRLQYGFSICIGHSFHANVLHSGLPRTGRLGADGRRMSFELRTGQPRACAGIFITVMLLRESFMEAHVAAIPL